MATTVSTYDQVGIKEEVADVINMISPTDTPFQSSIRTESVKNRLFEWLEEELRAPAKNAKVEGHDGVDSDRTQPVTRSNYTQILSETFKVTGTADVIDVYGRDKESTREMMRTGVNLKKDLEHSLVGTGQTAVAGTTAVAREFAGVQAQIDAATTLDNSGTPAALTEANVVSMHETLYNEGSDATTLMIKPSDSKIVAGWADDSGRSRDMKDGKIITNVVNIYVSPFGTVRIVLNRWLRATDALMYDPKYWRLVSLRPWFREMLAKTGDSTRWMMVGEYSLKHMNKKASALMTELT